VANENNDNNKKNQSAVKSKSFTIRLFQGIFKLFIFLILALVISVFIEWIGITFFWPEQGAMHSEMMMHEELKYLNDDFKNLLFGITPTNFAFNIASGIDYYLFEWTHIRNIIEWTINVPNEASEIRIFFASGIYILWEYIAAAINITQVFGIRLAIAILSTPAFILLGLAAFIDGLVQRELRRYGGDVERASVYHHVKRWMRPSIIGAWFIYLGMPISLHPNFIFLPAAFMFGLAVYLTSSMYKKYM